LCHLSLNVPMKISAYVCHSNCLALVSLYAIHFIRLQKHSTNTGFQANIALNSMMPASLNMPLHLQPPFYILLSTVAYQPILYALLIFNFWSNLDFGKSAFSYMQHLISGTNYLSQLAHAPLFLLLTHPNLILSSLTIKTLS